MKRHRMGMNSPTRKAGGLRRVMFALVVLLLAATVFVGAGSAAAVAQVDTTSYDDFSQAMNEWTTNGGTLKLLGNVETSSQYTLDKKTATLDLNGYILTHTATKGAAVIYKNGTKLTITDTVGTGKFTGKSAYLFQSTKSDISNDNEFTMAGGTLETTKTSSARVVDDDYGKFVMTGGTITTTGEVSSSGLISTKNGAISGGTITAESGTGYLISVGGKGSLTISGDATISAKNDVRAIKSSTGATLTINGGTISAADRVLFWGSDGTVEINGGTISGDISVNKLTIFANGGNLASATVTLNVDGSTFQADTSTNLLAENVRLDDFLNDYKVGKTVEDQVTIYKPMFDETTAEAIIDGTYYAKLSDAISAANKMENPTIVLNNPVMNDVDTIRSQVCTLDLNGYNIDATVTVNFMSKLTIVDTSSGTKGVITAPSDAEAIWVKPGGTLTIGEGVTVTGTKNDGDTGTILIGETTNHATYDSYGPATLNVYGTIIGNDDSAIKGSGNDKTGGTLINIYNGAVIESNNLAIYHPQMGTINVYGGKITGSTGIEMRSGSLNVKGGTISGSGGFSEAPNGSGSTVDGVGIAVSQHSTNLDISVTISGDAMIEGGKYALYEGDIQDPSTTYNIEVSITGGTFTATSAETGAAAVSSANVNEGFISGGTFSTKPDDKYLATGCTAVENSDGTYTVGKLHTITFNTNGGSAVTPITQIVGTTIEKPEDPTKKGYTFKGWDTEIPTTMPAGDMTIAAIWEKAEADTETEPTVDNAIENVNGNAATIKPSESGEETLSVEDSTVTIIADAGVTVKLTGSVTPETDGSITGTFNTVEAVYENIPAQSSGSVGSVSYGLNIPMNPGKVLEAGIPLPTIDSTFNEGTAGKLVNHNGNKYTSLAMIQASHAEGIDVINNNITGEITVTFTLPSSVGTKLVVFHVVNGVATLVEDVEITVDSTTGNIIVIAKGTGFSTYVVAQDVTPAPSSGSSSQGSSVWLQEIPTQTPTQTPTATQTPDVAPTDVVPTQPTATETAKSPGFGLLAALAGLGAVTVLRRK